MSAYESPLDKIANELKKLLDLETMNREQRRRKRTLLDAYENEIIRIENYAEYCNIAGE